MGEKCDAAAPPRGAGNYTGSMSFRTHRSATAAGRRRLVGAGPALALAAVLGAVLAAVVPGVSPGTVHALDRGAVNPLTRHFASLQVGPGHEFRLLTIHPLFANSLARGPEKARLAAGANPDTLGFTAPSGGRVLPLRLDNLLENRLIVFPGQIVRSDRYDLAFTEHVVVRSRSGTDAPLTTISEPAPAADPRPERRVLGAWLPPTLRFAIGPDAPHRDLPFTLQAWARDAGITTGRVSAADLARGTVVRARVADYVRALGALSRAPAGLQTVGYAVVVDGTPLIVESFADGTMLDAVWPGIIESLAVEAAVTEAREGLLGEEIAPSGQPDRFLAAVRALLLTFYERRPESHKTRQTGTVLTVTTPRGTVRGLVLDKDVFVHAVLVTDPRRRGKNPEDDFEPGVIGRKARPTQAEERWRDRRKDRDPTPPRPKPPDIPAPPK